ncbi:MAG: glycosyltransferase family 4 protein [Gemmatimonadales bacterium]|nr:glycosyltransferase family 4 protein [Gemmatimonadota bacterium]MCL4212882.1 glycosyltransferase family 4 protein [Gemmatimonadales bacterium]
MKLLAVNWQDIDNPLGGGAETHLHEILDRLAAWGHEVVLLCGGWAGCPSRAERNGVEIHRVGTRQTFAFHARRYWERELRGRGFDVLYEDINKVPLYTTRWGARRVVAVVPHLFGGAAFQELNPILATAVWLAERPLPRMYRDVPFQAISESTADDLVARGLRRDQVVVIPPGVSFDHYTPDPAARAPHPTFAYLGRLKKYKGVDLVIRAFARVRHPEAVLEIAGAGDHRPALEALVASLDLGARVRFLGFVSEAEKLALLRRSWAVALASPKEGWGLTNVEAEACGTPVVASDSPGIRESVRRGETGFLTPHGDIPAMAEALDRLAASPALVASMGRQARAFAETFTWDRCARATEAHLLQAINPGG